MQLPALDRLLSPLLRWGKVDLWYHPAYRLPLSGMENTGMEPRRADSAAWFLLEVGATRREQIHTPHPVSYAKLARVHDAEYLESLSRPETLAQIFAADPAEISVDALLTSVRLAVGGTVAASRFALAARTHTLNLLGGFHHARPNGGGGFCAVNDVAVAIAALRARGFKGRVAILDLDAHPPDGTALCVASDPGVWLGSISGSDWGRLPPPVEEILLPAGAGDGQYLEALAELLKRMPKPELAFVLAGGDVIQADKLGVLGLSLHGARSRDLAVFRALEHVPTTWLPAGGYHSQSWKILAGTGLVLSGRARRRIPPRYDPLSARFNAIARSLGPHQLSETGEEEEISITQDDVDPAFGRRASARMLGFYTSQGVEYALYRFGFLDHIQRLGFHDPRVELDVTGSGDRLRLYGHHEGQEQVLVEIVMERKPVGGASYLFTNWLTLRNPRARFSAHRPQLPGQDVPGLGLSRETTELMALIARRLGLRGVAFRPAWYHVAYTARHRFAFVDPVRQGRFEALVRDAAMAQVTLLEATLAIAEGKVTLNADPYKWEPDDMVFDLPDAQGQPSAAPATPERAALIRDERERSHFVFHARSPAVVPTGHGG